MTTTARPEWATEDRSDPVDGLFAFARPIEYDAPLTGDLELTLMHNLDPILRSEPAGVHLVLDAIDVHLVPTEVRRLAAVLLEAADMIEQLESSDR